MENTNITNKQELNEEKLADISGGSGITYPPIPSLPDTQNQNHGIPKRDKYDPAECANVTNVSNRCSGQLNDMTVCTYLKLSFVDDLGRTIKYECTKGFFCYEKPL